MISKGVKIKTFRFKAHLFIILQQKVLNCSCSVVYCSTTVLLSRQAIGWTVCYWGGYCLLVSFGLCEGTSPHQYHKLATLFFFWPGSCSESINIEYWQTQFPIWYFSLPKRWINMYLTHCSHSCRQLKLRHLIFQELLAPNTEDHGLKTINYKRSF